MITAGSNVHLMQMKYKINFFEEIQAENSTSKFDRCLKVNRGKSTTKISWKLKALKIELLHW